MNHHVIDFANISREVVYEYSNGTMRLFTPPDPFRLFERLGSLYLEGKYDHPFLAVDIRRLPAPINIFTDATDVHLDFLRFIWQDIPLDWWAFKQNIIVSGPCIITKAHLTYDKSAWVSMVGVPGKVKMVVLNSANRESLSRGHSRKARRGDLLLAPYPVIVAEKAAWEHRGKIAMARYDVIADALVIKTTEGEIIRLENMNYANMGGEYHMVVSDYFEMLAEGGEFNERPT